MDMLTATQLRALGIAVDDYILGHPWTSGDSRYDLICSRHHEWVRWVKTYLAGPMTQRMIDAACVTCRQQEQRQRLFVSFRRFHGR